LVARTLVYSSCNKLFYDNFLAIAEYSKLDFLTFDCTAEGILEKIEGKYLMTKIILKPTLTISDLNKIEKAQRVLELSEKACLISNSIKSEVILKPTINIEN